MNKALSNSFNHMFNEIIDDLIIYENFPNMEGMENNFLIRRRMENILATKPWYIFIQYFDGDGQLDLRVPNVDLSDDFFDLSEIIDRIRWSRAPFSTDLIVLPDGRKTLGIATPISKTSTSFEGGFIAFINLDILSDSLYQSLLGESGFIMILDGNGIILAHSDKSMIGNTIRQLSLLDEIWKGKTGKWEGILFEKDVILSHYPVSFGDMAIIVGEETKQAYLPTYRLSMLLIQCFILILITGVYSVYYGTSRIVKPIVSLTDQAMSYSKGEISNIEKIETGDELTALSETMHDMALNLIQKEKSLIDILESIPYGVITTDKNGIIKSFNQGGERLLLYNRNEVIGKSIFDLDIIIDGKNLLRYTLEKKEAVEEAETLAIDKLGMSHDIRLYSSTIQNRKDDNIGAIIIIRDVSELKKLQQHLYQSERLAALGQLTAGIAHEIKNPLNIISAATEALQKRQFKASDKDEYSLELLDTIMETSTRMDNLLQDFLKLSMEKTVEFLPVDIICVINDLISKLKTTFYENDITILKKYDTVESLILGDKNKISQVFLNIILNSVQAMDNGGILEISIRKEKKDWLIVIKDTGKGIKESNIKRIFNPFFSTKQTGTGLGLAIVHEIINQHNGNISVESEVNNGTTIICTLPVYTDVGGD